MNSVVLTTQCGREACLGKSLGDNEGLKEDENGLMIVSKLVVTAPAKNSLQIQPNGCDVHILIPGPLHDDAPAGLVAAAAVARLAAREDGLRLDDGRDGGSDATRHFGDVVWKLEVIWEVVGHARQSKAM